MENEELNEKLLRFADFRLDYIKGEGRCYAYPDNKDDLFYDRPDLTESLDALFKWLVPKAIKLLADSDLSSDEEGTFKLFDLWLKEYWTARQEPISLALALCKAIEKVIDKKAVAAR